MCLLRNEDRDSDTLEGRNLSKISFGTRILHRRGIPSVGCWSSHSKLAATTGSCSILSRGCMPGERRQLGENLVLSAFHPLILG